MGDASPEPRTGTDRRAPKSADKRELDAWLARYEKDVFDKLLDYPYALDIDNTVKPIFGHQEGAELGYNPQKPGRPSHNFHPYFIGSIRIWGMRRLAASQTTASLMRRRGETPHLPPRCSAFGFF